MFALFIFTVCVRPFGSLPLCSSQLSPGEERPEAEPAPAAQAKWKAFLAHSKNRWAYWFSSSSRLPCAGWSEQSNRLWELQLCTQARRSCTFSHFQDVFTSQIKARLAVCFCLSLSREWFAAWLVYGQQPPEGEGASWGTPARWAPPGWLGLALTKHTGDGVKGPAAAGQWSKDDLQRTDCSFPLWSVAGVSVASAKARRRWLTEVTQRWPVMELTSDSVCSSDQSYYRWPTENSTVGHSSVLMGDAGLCLELGRLHFPCPHHPAVSSRASLGAGLPS